jgi:hypothetical protein
VVIFEDDSGNIMVSDEVEELSEWEIEERGVHALKEEEYPC